MMTKQLLMTISNNIFYHLRYSLIGIIALVGCSLQAQSSYFKNNEEVYEIVDRFQHQNLLSNDIHSSLRLYARSKIFSKLMSIDTSALSSKYQYDLNYLLNDTIQPSTQRGLIKSIYQNPAHFLSYQSPSFEFVLNPILNFNLGHDLSEDQFVFQNTRGIELYGTLDKRLYFYTSFYENQSNFLSYITSSIERDKAILGQGNYKDYQSSVIDAFQGYDYSNAQAYLGYKLTDHAILELGHGKHFIGNGMRSLLLSDIGHNYFYFKFRVEVWKLLYQSVISELSGLSARFTPNNELLPKKYMASHYLDLNISDRLSIGLFESVIFSRENQFELQYLNPLILYRTVEHGLDSPDNVLLGMNLSWRPIDGMSLYGQILIDELSLSELTSSEGWWGNKYGLQLGVKSFDFLGIDHLDTQVEFNMVRPYTYSHRIELQGFEDYSITSYSHNNQPLAHPLGANFNEIILRIKYRLSNKLRSDIRYLYARAGRNNDLNYGNNVLLNNSSRISDYGNAHLQGVSNNINMIDVHINYELFYKFFLDFNFRYRNDNNDESGQLNNNYFGFGIRYNVSVTQIDY